MSAQTWEGNGADAKLSTASNWFSSTLPVADQTATFATAGSSGALLNWDIATALNLEFSSGASAYTLEGGPMSWSQASSLIRNSSTNQQTFNIAINRAGNGTLDAVSGSLLFNSSLTVRTSMAAADGNANLTVKGAGGVTFGESSAVLTNRLVVNQSGVLTINGATTVDGGANAGSATVGAGVLNVGAGVGGGNGTLTVGSTGSLEVNGTTASAKQNTIIGSSGGTGVVNITGGSMTIGANSGFIIGNANSSTVGIGTLNVDTGTVTIQASAALPQVMLGVVSGTKKGTGTINLNGGLLESGRQFAGGDSAQATFNFNGGTLRALGNQSDWFSNVTTVVASGGAVIDSNGFNITVNSALLDGGGGLTKQGGGTLTLGGANTYTGATAITGGSLALDADATLASTSVSIAAGAILDVSAKNGYDLTSISTTIYLNEIAAGFIEAGDGNVLTLGSSALTLNFTSSDLGAGASYDLFNAGSTSGNFGSVSIAGSFSTSLVRAGDTWSGVSGHYAFSFDQSTGGLTVTASAIPEPSTYAAIAGAIVLGAVAWRRRKSLA